MTDKIDSVVDVEATMAQIREMMQENRRAAQAQGLQPRQFVFADFPEEPTSGNYDVELYAQLRQVNRPHQILGIQRLMRSSFLTKLPVIGLIWQKIQRAGHDLVIFYVNGLAEEVASYQQHVARVLNRLVGRNQAQEIELKLLQAEVQALKERLTALESKQ